MKTKILSLLAIAGLLTFAGCANDDTTNNNNNDQESGTEGLTSFVEEENATRTTGEYDGSGLKFYWTQGDRLWVNTGTALAPVLTQDSKNNISDLLVDNPANSSAVKRAAKASFAFEGTYTAPSYPVRYTGTNGAKDKVTIKAAQTQNTPNDASHIGEDGDFGVAQAQKQSDGKYHFTLDHKAAYITFIPYTNQSEVASAKIIQIRVYTGNSSDALAGTFDLADDGTLSNPTGTSNSVELSVPNFSIPNAFSYTTNGSTMVVNPGTYNNVSIEYTLWDPVAYVRGTITKTYPSVTFAAGKNKKVKTDLQVRVYPQDNYATWDAQQHYWYGHLDSEGKPDNKNNYPQNNTDPRWCREDASLPAPAANLSAKDCPNVNECAWYVMQGDPHRDNELWATMGHIRKGGGIWFKKKAKIPGFTNTNYNGTDYRTTNGVFSRLIPQGRPSNLNDYFYLPMLGFYNNGMWDATGVFYYWSSTPSVWSKGAAYCLIFESGTLQVTGRGRRYGFQLWTAQ